MVIAIAAVSWGLLVLVGPIKGLLLQLLPTAYVIDGLVALSVVAATLAAVTVVLHSIAMGARKEPSILTAQGMGSAVTVAAIAPLASAVGANAQPSSAIAGSVVQIGFLGHVLKRQRQATQAE